MKRALLLALFLFAGKALLAQSNPPVCGIYYDYDAVGQRIKRSYDCRVPPGEGGTSFPDNPTSKLAPPGREEELTPPGREELGAKTNSNIQVFPNPTAGPYTISLSEIPKQPVHFHWYNERGQILSSGTLTGPETSGNITSWADGMYLLQVYMPAGTESFRIVKITGTH